jgi:serine protease AprX
VGAALCTLGLPVLADAQPAPPDIPDVAQSKARAAEAPAFRGDANADGISDSLEAMIEAGEPGEKFDVIVVFDGPGGVARSRAAVGRFDVAREFSVIHGFQASMTAAQIRALASTPGPIRIEENATVTAFDAISNDDTGATDARASYGLTGAGVTICVLDTGINPNHEQFNSKGLTADDFADFVNSQPNPYDDHWHGTHVAGIVAGDGGTDVGPDDPPEHVLVDDAIGVAPDASLKAAKVLSSAGTGSTAQIVDGIEWCAGITEPNNADVDILSMSLGSASTDGSDALSIAVNCVADPYDPSYSSSCGDTPQGWVPKIVVVSAGNSGARPGTIGAPGVAKNAITVASFAEWSGEPTTGPDNIWQDDGVFLNPFSSRGPVSDGAGGTQPWIKPDITAVGSRVLSAYVNDAANPSSTAYASASGTSMAAPQISGLIALMLQANSSLGDEGPGGQLPHEKVRAILHATAIDRGAPGPDHEYGWGLVDAYAAIAEASGDTMSYAPTEYPSYTQVSGSVSDNGNWTYGFEVTAAEIDLPIAATLTAQGVLAGYTTSCSSVFPCWWDPDLELVVEEFSGGVWSQVDPVENSGSAEVTRSECPDIGECGSVGRVELVHFIAKTEGQYRFRVYPFAGGTNNGKGGSFELEISMGVPASQNAAPVVTIDEPLVTTYDETETIFFAASAADVEDDNGALTGSNSWSWASDIDGPIGGVKSSFSTSDLSVGVHTVTASVTDSGGKRGQDTIIVTVTTVGGDTPPIVTIDAPADGSTYTEGQTVTFAGTADDAPDGDLTADLDWSSDLDGPLHTNGGGFSTSGLNVGTHEITASVTDGGGLTGTASITITVDPPTLAHVEDLADFSMTAPRSRWHAVAEVMVKDADGGAVPNATVTGNWSDGATGSDDCITLSDGTCRVAKYNLKGNVASAIFTVQSITGSDSNGADVEHDASNDVETSIVLTPPGPNRPPVASFTVAENPCPAVVDFAYQCYFTSTSTDPDSTNPEGDDDIASCTWDYGDGSPTHSPDCVVPALYIELEPKSYWVTLTVTDKDGATDSISQLVHLGEVLPNQAPTVEITAPTNGASFTEGTSIQFTGSASDTEDGDVTGDLVWTSDLTGEINTGGSFSTTLAVGTHTINASVTDTGNLTGAAQVTVTVNAAPPGSINLTATGYKVKGVQHAALTWTGANGADVTITRNTAPVTLNSLDPVTDGNYDDDIGVKGGGSYTYQVCTTGGTPVCSNTAGVIF